MNKKNIYLVLFLFIILLIWLNISRIIILSLNLLNGNNLNINGYTIELPMTKWAKYRENNSTVMVVNLNRQVGTFIKLPFEVNIKNELSYCKKNNFFIIEGNRVIDEYFCIKDNKDYLLFLSKDSNLMFFTDSNLKNIENTEKDYKELLKHIKFSGLGFNGFKITTDWAVVDKNDNEIILTKNYDLSQAKCFIYLATISNIRLNFFKKNPKNYKNYQCILENQKNICISKIVKNNKKLLLTGKCKKDDIINFISKSDIKLIGGEN